MRWRESKTVQVKTTLLSIAIKGRKKKNVTSEKMQCQERDFFFLFWALFYGFFFKYMEPISVYSFELSLISLLYASCSRDP